ncbi:MAG: cysteine hydrolase family protein [Trebonia sp.]
MTDPTAAVPVLAPTATAVINVHWQYDIVRREGAFGQFFADEVERRDVVNHARYVLAVAREHSALVVHARAAFRPGYPDLIANCALFEQVAAAQCLQEGTRGAEIIDELTPQAGELVIPHARLSAFQGTELELMLRARGIVNVLMTGVATNIAVESTARDAVNIGYRTVLIADACATADTAAHEATLATFALLGSVLQSADLAAAFAGS